MITLTKPQRKAVHRVYMRTTRTHVTYRQFRRQVQPAFGMDCVMVPFAGMWLGIEPDGYTHS